MQGLGFRTPEICRIVAPSTLLYWFWAIASPTFAVWVGEGLGFEPFWV